MTATLLLEPVAELKSAEVGEPPPSAEVLTDPYDRARLRLAETLAATPATVEQLRPRLHGLVDDALAKTADPQKQLMLSRYRSEEDYLLFGQPGDTPPPEIIFQNDFKRVTIHLDTIGTGYCSSCSGEAMQAIGGKEMGEIKTVLRKERDSRYDEIVDAAEEFLRTLPVVDFIRSMGATMPVSAAEDPMRRMVKETAVRRDVETRFGTSIEDPTMHGRGAKREYLRGLARLDLEEPDKRDLRSAHGDQPSTSVVIARERILSVLESSNGLDPGQMQIDSELDSNGKASYFGRVPVAGNVKVPLMNMCYDTVRELGLIRTQISSIDETEQRYNAVIMAFVCEQIFDPTFNGTFDEAVESAIIRCSKQFFTDLDYSMTGYTEYFWRMPPAGTKVHVAPSYYDLKSIAHRDWHEKRKAQSPDNLITFSSRAEIAKEEMKVLGRVLHGPKGRNGRLIQAMDGLPVVDFATPGANEELVIRLKLGGLEGRPHIPGYILTSAKTTARGTVYGFIKDPEGDPYARSTMLVPNIDKLADKYESIGLHTLADALRNCGQLTVAQLAWLISGETYYPTDRETKERKLPESFVLGSLDDEGLQTIIKNKRLWSQCSGSAQFMALSLRYCGMNAGVVTGNIGKLSHRMIIRRAIKNTPHAQTFVNFQGKRYIVDATGRLEASQQIKLLAIKTGQAVANFFRLFRHIGRHEEAPRISRPPVVLPESVGEPEATSQPSKTELRNQRDEKLRRIRHSLETSIGAFMGTRSREELMDKLAKRDIQAEIRRGDPLFRTLSLITIIADGNADEKELDGLASYLTDYRDNPDRAASLGHPPYPSTLINLFYDYIEQARRAVALTA